MAFTRRTIKDHLDKLSENWNDDYWIYVANGEVFLMRKKDGQRVMDAETGGVDRRFISSAFHGMDADGGDW